MKIDTALNHYERFRTRLVDIYTSAKIGGHTATWINDEVKKWIYSDPAWSKCPGWVHSRLQGYRDAMMASVYRYEIVWTLELDGKRYLSKSPELEGNYSRVGNGSHAWRQHWEKGVFKPY